MKCQKNKQKVFGQIGKEMRDWERQLWEAIHPSECIRTKAALLDMNLSRNMSE